MARAKRTERAEARRRYRAATAEPSRIDDADAEPPTPRPGPTKAQASSPGAEVRAPPGRPAGSASPTRSGSRSARSTSARTSAALPWIATHTHALWIPLADHRREHRVRRRHRAATDIDQRSSCSRTSSRPRPSAACSSPASWRRGRAGCSASIVGLVVGHLLLDPGRRLRDVVHVAATADGGCARDVVVSAFVLSPVIGAFFAAGAAWYRRFLALSNPNRGQPAVADAKAEAGRRPDADRRPRRRPAPKR